jgi:phosphoglycerate kinase
MALKYVDQMEFKGKRVVARFDFNVPLDKKDPNKITDTTRIDKALPTIRYILDHGASKLVLMSHLGRPDGKPNPKMSLNPVAVYLAQKLDCDVILTKTSVDCGVSELLNLNTTKVVLLENLRFHAEEEANDREFARKLSAYGNVYVNDAFGTAHREHASTWGIVEFFNKNEIAGGFLLKEEVEGLSKIVDNPKKPLMAILGGAKVADKIKIIERLLVMVDKLFIGGAMAYPFLKAQGHSVGTSLCSPDDVELAKKILANDPGKKIVLPLDHVIADNPQGTAAICDKIDIPDGKMALDIGPKTIEAYSKKLANSATIFWNGPMGYFENESFAKGTFAIAKVLADSKAFTLVGGGDSVSALNKSGLDKKISHVSTGGGASLEFIEQGSLPGVQALKFGVTR